MTDATQCDRCGQFFQGDPALELRVNHYALASQEPNGFDRVDTTALDSLQHRVTNEEGEYCGTCCLEILNGIPPMEGGDD